MIPVDPVPMPAPSAMAAQILPNGNSRWDLPPHGSLVYNVAARSLDAHCNCEAHKQNRRNPCRLNRTIDADSRRGQSARGRPLGFLLAWLWHSDACGDSPSHKNAAKPKECTDADREALSLTRRQAARQWAKDNLPSAVFEKERIQYLSEPEEPELWP